MCEPCFGLVFRLKIKLWLFADIEQCSKCANASMEIKQCIERVLTLLTSWINLQNVLEHDVNTVI